MTETDKKRANSLLVTLHFCGGNGQARKLREDLETVHGVPATLDRVRMDLRWLADVGLLLRTGDTVMLTEEGREVATGLRELP